ncbi:MAG: type III PLP-dependent enzyme [Mycoplasmataceae bacterium]|nr:type III PLP-dependent enzyme [Mycoplasmataceae bacterium]
MNIKNYLSDKQWKHFYSESKKYKTPFVLVSKQIINDNFNKIKTNFPYAQVYTAIKANPCVDGIEVLNKLGSNFDIATIYELDMLLKLKVNPSRMSFGNTIKKKEDVAYAYKKGVRLFVSDSISDLENIAKYAPKSKVFFRILVDGSATAEWPLSLKFGADVQVVEELIYKAKALKLIPVGISFHVGSQQNDVNTWDKAIGRVSALFNKVAKNGIVLNLLNMGGGFPAHYIKTPHLLQEYAKNINVSLNKYFGNNIPTIILEPGRSLFGNAGVLVSEVILISKKTKTTKDKWLYVDSGIFNGLIETLGESIKYPLYVPNRKGKDSKEFIIAGPTCDSADIMYKDFRNPLPKDIKIGDRIFWLSTGAYTSSYASVNFNSFPPIKTYFI